MCYQYSPPSLFRVQGLICACSIPTIFDYVAIECSVRFTKVLSQKITRFASKFVLTIKASSTWLYFRTLRPVFTNHNGYVINFDIPMIMPFEMIISITKKFFYIKAHKPIEINNN